MYVSKTTDSAVLPFYDISSFQKKNTWFLTLFNLINNHTFYSINKPKYARSSFSLILSTGQFKKTKHTERFFKTQVFTLYVI